MPTVGDTLDFLAFYGFALPRSEHEDCTMKCFSLTLCKSSINGYQCQVRIFRVYDNDHTKREAYSYRTPLTSEEYTSKVSALKAMPFYKEDNMSYYHYRIVNAVRYYVNEMEAKRQRCKGAHSTISLPS